MPISPNSLTITAASASEGLASHALSSVVFPLPRKPVSSVVGKRSAAIDDCPVTKTPRQTSPARGVRGLLALEVAWVVVARKIGRTIRCRVGAHALVDLDENLHTRSRHREALADRHLLLDDESVRIRADYSDPPWCARQGLRSA